MIVPSEGYRDQRWKYGRYQVPGHEAEGEMRYEELYDLKIDPAEATNLTAIPQYQPQLDRVRSEWARWRQAVR